MSSMNFTDLVDRIRTERQLDREVPGFDPSNGNEEAKYLFLLEAPGAKAVQSGQISLDNPDPSARNLRDQLSQAGINRKDIALWNVVPWYIGNDTGTAIRAASGQDVREALGYLKPLISAMPNLACIILIGGAARNAHVYLSRITTARILACHHPSARVVNTNPATVRENIELFRFIKDTR